ncbi:MAG TPA: hypothetical protein VNZ86_02640 [Bacteroidia bacterium]|nr:hypothetical protein [Bacteroidia bacterium]
MDVSYSQALFKADSSYEFKWMQGPFDHNPQLRPQFEASKSLYLKASRLKPEEHYPLRRLEEIDHVLNYFISFSVYARADSLLKKNKMEESLPIYSMGDSLYSTPEAKERIRLCRKLMSLPRSDSSRLILQDVIRIDSLCKATDENPALLEGVSEGEYTDKKGGFETYYLKDRLEGGNLFRIRNNSSKDQYVKTIFYYSHKKVIRASMEIEDPKSGEQPRTVYTVTYYFKDGQMIIGIGEDKQYPNAGELYKQGENFLLHH